MLTSALVSKFVSYDNSRRRAFQRTFQVREAKAIRSHPHGRSAADRTAASVAIGDFALAQGLDEYIVSSSSRDDAEAPGYHAYYEVKDLQHRPKVREVVPNRHLVKIIDADYYVDINKYISTGAHIALYTFVPQTVGQAESDREYVYSISDDTITYTVSGGCSYSHQIWDYDQDFVCVKNYWGAQLCTIDSVQVDPCHRVVFIAPYAHVKAPWSWFLKEQNIKRMKYTHNVWNGVRYVKLNLLQTLRQDNKLWMSMAQDGSPCSVDLPVTVYQSAIERFRETQHPTMATLERYLRSVEDAGLLQFSKQAFVAAANMYPIIKALSHDDLPYVKVHTLTAAPSKKPPQYQAIGKIEDGYLQLEDGKSLMRMHGEPVVNHTAVVPKASYNNDLQSVVGRIERVYNNVIPPARYIRYARDFVNKVVQACPNRIPWTIEQVVEAQQKPNQRLHNAAVVQWMTLNAQKVSVRAFMKQEPYGKVTDPRNISQLPPEHNLRLGQYVYALSEELHQLPWFMPGKTPKEIAGLVHRYVRDKTYVYPTDYSRWDGTVSLWMKRYIESAVLLAWVPEDRKQEVLDLIGFEAEATGVTKHGVFYDPAGTRLSGSMLTSYGNTLMNAFVSFCAFRDMSYNADLAWASIGPTCGDDGITSAAMDCMTRCAKQLGVTLKIDKKAQGDMVPFLGRVFIEPWVNDWSLQDPARTLQKLTLLKSNPSISDDVALYNRARGYAALDPSAPVLSAWCSRTIARLLRNNPNIGTEAERVQPTERDVPYYVILSQLYGTETWPAGPAFYERNLEAYAESLGVDPSEISEYDRYLRNLPLDATLDRVITSKPVPQTINAYVTRPDGDSLHCSLPGRSMPSGRRLVQGSIRDKLPTKADQRARHDWVGHTGQGLVPTGNGRMGQDRKREVPSVTRVDRRRPVRYKGQGEDDSKRLQESKKLEAGARGKRDQADVQRTAHSVRPRAQSGTVRRETKKYQSGPDRYQVAGNK